MISAVSARRRSDPRPMGNDTASEKRLISMLVSLPSESMKKTGLRRYRISWSTPGLKNCHHQNVAQMPGLVVRTIYRASFNYPPQTSGTSKRTECFMAATAIRIYRARVCHCKISVVNEQSDVCAMEMDDVLSSVSF